MRTKLFFTLFLSLFFGATLHAGKRREAVLIAVNPEAIGDLTLLKETCSIQEENTICIFLEKQGILSRDLQMLGVSANKVYNLASSARIAATAAESDINFLGTTVLHYASWGYRITIFLEEVPAEEKNLNSLKKKLEESVKKPRSQLTLIYKKGKFPESFTSLKRRVTFQKLSDLKKEKQETGQIQRSAAPYRPRQRTLSIDPSLEQWERGARSPSPDEAKDWRNPEFKYRAAKLSPPPSTEEKFFAED